MEWREAVSDGQSGGKKRTIGEKRTIGLIVREDYLLSSREEKNLPFRIINQIVLFLISSERTNSYLLEKITICLFGY